MFNKNLNALKSKNPVLAEKLENISLGDIKDNIEVYQAESGDVIIAYEGLALDDIYDPIRVAKTNWNLNVNNELKKYDIVVVYGLGLGYLFKRAYISCDCRILMYEPKIDILRYVLEYVDFSNEILDDRVYFTTDKVDALNFLTEKYLSDDNLVFLYPNAYAQLMTNEMAEFTSDVVEVCNLKKMDVNTITRLAKKWAQHSLVNLTNMQSSRPVVWLKDAFKDKIALIAAAGPSLRDNIDIIKKNRDKFILISVNRAAPVLYDNDIIPDFVMFADVAEIDALINKYEKQFNQSTIIADARANNSIFKSFQNVLIYFSKNDLIAQHLSNITENAFDLLETAGTAATQAYYCAKLFGINEIIFAGLDLAFKGNVIYADGRTATPDENNQVPVDTSKTYKKNVLQIKDLNGKMVLTRDDYALFVRQFEDIFSTDSSSKLYNVTDFGAYIKGMEYKSLSDVLAEKISLDICPKDILSKFLGDTSQNWDKIFADIQDVLKKEKTILSDIALKTSELLQKELTLLKEVTENSQNSVSEKELQDLSSDFSQLLPEIVADPFLSQYFQSEFVNFVNMNGASINQGIETYINLKNFEIKLLEGIVDICGIWVKFLSEKFK